MDLFCKDAALDVGMNQYLGTVPTYEDTKTSAGRPWSRASASSVERKLLKKVFRRGSCI